MLFFVPLLISAEQKSSAQYSIELFTFHDREILAREQIAQEQAQIDLLRQKIAEADHNNNTVNSLYGAHSIFKLKIERTEQVHTVLRQKADILKRTP